MSLAPGVRLGAYEVIAPLGAGGMGELYRARDPRLGRDVAVKVLPAAFSPPIPDRLRSLRAGSPLRRRAQPSQHLAVHDIGQHDGSPIVSELLEGETLRERL